MFSLYSLFSQLSSPITNLHIERRSTNVLHTSAVSVHGWRSTMEDAHNICLQLNDHGLMLFGVYDGHGGPRCAQYLSKQIPLALSGIKDIRHDHEIAALFCNIDRQFLREENSEDGSTACVVLAQWWDKDRSIPLHDLPLDYNAINYPSIVLKCLAINVGDSRATIISSDGRSYTAMTKDHKPTDPAEQQRIYDAGGYVQANRIDGNLALSRSFGDKTYKSNESFAFNEQKVICVPDITTHYLTPGSMLLVCCDGLFEADAMTYDVFRNIAHTSRQHYSRVATIPHEPFQSYLNLNQLQMDQLIELNDNVNTIENFDTAGVARDLIVKSHEMGSKDNHSAIVVHFCPTQQKPLHPDGYEFIPGPCHSLSPDTTFLRSYRADISPLVDFKSLIPRISATDNDYLLYCYWYDNMLQFMSQLRADYEYNQQYVTHYKALLANQDLDALASSPPSNAPTIDTSAISKNPNHLGVNAGYYNPNTHNNTNSSNTVGTPNRDLSLHVNTSSLPTLQALTTASYNNYCGGHRDNDVLNIGTSGQTHPLLANSTARQFVFEKPMCSQLRELIAVVNGPIAAAIIAANAKNGNNISNFQDNTNTPTTTNNNNNSSNNPSTTEITLTSSSSSLSSHDKPLKLSNSSSTHSITTNATASSSSSQPSQQAFDQAVVNLYYPLPYFGLYLPTGTTLMPFYFPSSRTQYPEWLDAFVQHSLSHGDDCDYY